MNQVYNEIQYAKRAIVKKKIDRQNGKTLAILCKYYYFEENKTKKQIHKLLCKFIDESNGVYEKENVNQLIEKYTNEKERRNSVTSINITLSEISKILSRECENEQKIMFALLVSCKMKNEYCKINNLDNFVGEPQTSESFGEYFKDVKLKFDKYKRGEIFRSLENAGLICVANDIKKSIKLNYIDESDAVAFKVYWQNDIWLDLLIYKGKNYKRCESCGDAIKITKTPNERKPSKYCSDECKKYENVSKTRENMRKIRNV